MSEADFEFNKLRILHILQVILVLHLLIQFEARVDRFVVAVYIIDIIKLFIRLILL